MSKRHMSALLMFVLLGSVAICVADEDKAVKPLPFPEKFEAERYLGKWYEAARLPTPVQPDNTLASAAYSAGDEQGVIKVKNTAFDQDGKELSAIEGKARLLPDSPPRLAVSFGPVIPEKANYFVIHVDKKYRHAVVGTPDRKSLWILARKVPVPPKRLAKLKKVAEDADFPVEKLVVSDWSKHPAATPARKKFAPKQLIGQWRYESGDRGEGKRGKEHYANDIIEISKDKFVLKGEEMFVMTYELDTKSDPVSIRFEIIEAPFAVGSKAAGIIELRDGKLHLCYNAMNGEAPKAFTADADKGHALFVLTREEK